MLTQKIHKKFRFQPNAKIFAIFFLIQYRDFTKWKTIFGVIGTLKISFTDLMFPFIRLTFSEFCLWFFLDRLTFPSIHLWILSNHLMLLVFHLKNRLNACVNRLQSFYYHQFNGKSLVSIFAFQVTIVFPVRNFMHSLELYYKNSFCRSLRITHLN